MPARDVIRFWFPDPETLYTAEGYLGPNAINTDAAKFAAETLRSQYQNDATPKVVMKPLADAAKPNDVQWERWQNDFMRKYNQRMGSRRGLPAKLPTGWDLIQLSMETGVGITPLLEFWQSNQLLNFGVPQSVLGRVVSGDRSSAETNQYVFDLHTIYPIASLIADTLTRRLARDYDASIFVEFEEFVSADKDYKLRQEAQDLTLKVRSAQQILADRGDDPEAATWGEYPVGTLADQPYTGEDQEFDMGPDDPNALFEPDAPDGERKRMRADLPASFDAESEWERVTLRERKFRPRFERALRGVFEAQRKETIKRLRAMFSDRSRAGIQTEDLFDAAAWSRVFELRVDPIRRASYVESASEAMTNVSAPWDFEFTETVAKSLREQGAVMVKNINATTRARIVKALQQSMAEGTEGGESVDEVAKRINKVFSGRRKNATTIARTELHRSSQLAQIEGFKQSGVVEWKRWNDNRDAEVRDSHVASLIDVVKLDEPFTLASGLRCMAPNDPMLPVEEVANCRCFVTPVFDDPKGIQK